MVYPGPPPGAPRDPDEPARHLPRYDDEDDLDVSNIRRRPPADSDLSTGDWLLCIFCSGIACLVGIVRLIQGKPHAGKMIGIAFLFSIMWRLVILMITSLN